MSTQHFDDYINELLEEIKDFERVRSSDIPNIDLYMDQVTTFMDDHLGLFKRNDDDKVLTKTMINNYSKYDLLPPTVKKKYTNDHIVMMLFIYYLKPILSITDIKELLYPIREMFANGSHPSHIKDLKEFHDRVVESEYNNYKIFEERMQTTMNIAKDMFSDVEDEDQQELLSIFSTAYLFTIQASAQKHMITSLIDSYLTKNFESDGSKKTNKDKPSKDKASKDKASK